jgi:hypothetical protein
MSVQKEFEGRMMVATFLQGQEKIQTSLKKEIAASGWESKLKRKQTQNDIEKLNTGFEEPVL